MTPLLPYGKMVLRWPGATMKLEVTAQLSRTQGYLDVVLYCISNIYEYVYIYIHTYIHIYICIYIYILILGYFKQLFFLGFQVQYRGEAAGSAADSVHVQSFCRSSERWLGRQLGRPRLFAIAG